jgi:polyphenol oxidase
VHGVDVVALSTSSNEGAAADAGVTTAPLVACTIMVADCLPLLLTDDAGRVVAAAHAGWRGLAGGVVENTMRAVCAAAGVSPAQVRVWLGPCIGPEAFEVGDEVREAFISTSPSDASLTMRYFKPHPTHRHKWLADLAGLARLRLHALGVTSLSGNDSSLEWCTVSQPSRLFSYRRDGVTGRFAVCIWRR